MEREEGIEIGESEIHYCVLDKVNTLFDLNLQEWNAINRQYKRLSIGFHKRLVDENGTIKLVDKFIFKDKGKLLLKKTLTQCSKARH